MSEERYCWICGRNGSEDPLDEHHIFGGAYRKKSERDGLKVYLCHGRCHIFGKYAAHNNAETMRKLRAWGQREAMRRFGWTTAQFVSEYGKNYLDESSESRVESEDEVSPEATDEKETPPSAPLTPPLKRGGMSGEENRSPASKEALTGESQGGYGVEESGQMSIIFAPMPYFYVTAEELPF